MVLCCKAVNICRPCLNPKWPLRKQLLSAFLTLAALSLLLALGVVLGTAVYTGHVAETEARRGLEEQIERHILNASAEAAATIGERFRRIQYGVVDMTAYAYRDAMQEDLELADGTTGYPLSNIHVDLRDTEIAQSGNLESSVRQKELVDFGRSVWYFANELSFEAEVSSDDMGLITQSSRLDLLWPTAYTNSNDTKAVYVAVELSETTHPAFRQFPGTELSNQQGTLFGCEGGDSENECYDPSVRPWYILAVEAARSDDTYLGAASITEPYSDASSGEWMVTAARAVYSDSSSASSPRLLGVVGVDIMLQQVQSSIERVTFLKNGYSMLVAAIDGTVIAAPDHLWDRRTETNTSTVCDLGIGICDEGWDTFVEDTEGGAYHFTSLEDGEDNVLVAAPVNGSFGVGGEGEVVFYIISVVPQSEIYEPAEGMSDLIEESTIQILITTGIVAGVTLAAVAIAVCVLSGAITRPIADMTSAADSISRDGAKTDVFGNAAKTWNGKEAGSGGTSTLEYLLCSGDDEIKLLGREFGLMISGLGKRGRAARATELEGTTVYPVNPFTPSNRPDSSASSAPEPKSNPSRS